MTWRDHIRVPCAFCGVNLLEEGVVEEQVEEIYFGELLELDIEVCQAAKRGVILSGHPLTPAEEDRVRALARQIGEHALAPIGVDWCSRCCWERSAGGVIPHGAIPLEP